MNANNLINAKGKARLIKLDQAATARQKAADAIANRCGYRNGNDAFRCMGQAFIALVKQRAPSINAAMVKEAGK